MILFNPIGDGYFRAAHGWEQKAPPALLKICHTYSTMMKLGTVIHYLKKIQKLFKSCDTLLNVFWHQHFLPEIKNV